MYEIVSGIFKASGDLFRDMAFYLLLGMLFAGLLREFISAKWIGRHLGRGHWSSVIKAALLGIPLPLCSCGVVPPTMTLHKAGANRGSVLSFLIATPTTGIDSILATYALLGPFFTLYRVMASFLAAVFTGLTANLFNRPTAPQLGTESNEAHSVGRAGLRLWRAVKFGFGELLGEISNWLLLGLVIGGVITYALPDDFFHQTLANQWQSMLVMLVIGIPFYVCATGSIPIAAALMLKGLNPGAAFVFLLTGPATNAVSLTLIGKALGRTTTALYLAALSVSALGLGLLLNLIWPGDVVAGEFYVQSVSLLPAWLEWSSAIVLFILIFSLWIKNMRLKGAPRT